MDFVHDQLAVGSKLRILTVIDTCSRFSPAVVPRFNFLAPDVIEVLERVRGEVGYAASIRLDQASEFVSRDLDLWAEQLRLRRRAASLDGCGGVHEGRHAGLL
ncbi:integrase catalytic domain-containing protein [Sphingomonas radiodurans]|uniref:integrase catalytic domain-containing protein n=1 Tax=Sphingomonas radiodurans TaxID=2890321 RepID=UPI0038CDC4A9